ncbi:MAG TPA: Tn3 family transposase [Ktedonobacteraceae bacterium]|nr:Tn3 family transposase [Ktedonobacteraceae bacterium]
MREMLPRKRYTLAAALLLVQSAQALDDLAEMLIKRMLAIHQKGKEALQQYHLEHQARTDALVTTLRDLVVAYRKEGTTQERFAAIEGVLGEQSEEVLKQCEEHLAYAGNTYQQFLWSYYKSHRATLFRLLSVVTFRSSTQDTSMEAALRFLQQHEASRGEWLVTALVEHEGAPEAQRIELLDLSWVLDVWWKLVSGTSRRVRCPDRVQRRHFEVCVFSQLMWGLKSGDLYVEGGDHYADYRDQLIPWSRYQQELADYGKLVELPTEGKAFVAHVRAWLEERARQTDATFPNEDVRIEKGEPIIRPLDKKPVPEGLPELEAALAERLQPVNILDVLTHTEQWLNWTHPFGPISGYDSKLEHPVARYLTAVFCFGCNLGPSQTSRSLDAVDRRDVAWVNQRHITIENLDEAIRLVIHAYHRFDLPRFWGKGKHASADGTKWEMYEQNLLAEYHIRYGGYGGIGYYHVSDNYIARFSHFIPCGVWEGSFILDIFEQEDKEPKPETLHGDTQAQSSTIFGMAYLLGIALMPRIRNWKDLNLFRPSPDAHYTHIETLFSDTVDWNVIETHLPDMLRVVLSVKAGTIKPSTILRKLGTYSRRNKLYQAFRELGDVVRTEFLLHLLGDPDLRSMLQSAMNKSEAFNGFAKWVLFGGEGGIAENRREEQRKIIKFNHLVANCVILYNVFVVSKELQKLALEGREFDEQAVAALSPYIRQHINRFGHYELDLTQHSPPIEYDLPIPTKKRQEQLTGQATPTRRKKKPKKKRKKTAVRQMRLFSAEEDF